jgi:DNA-binding CsgD family transcriptional regulator
MAKSKGAWGAALKRKPPKNGPPAPLSGWDALGQRIFGVQPSDAARQIAGLTPREQEVVGLAGKSAKEMADELDIDAKTVEIHLQSIYKKLRIKGRQMLVLHLASRFWAEAPKKGGA